MGYYAEALQAYQASQTLWQVKIEDAQYDWLEGQISYKLKNNADPRLIPIVEKYHLRHESNRIREFPEVQTLSPDAIQIVWKAASQMLEKANKLYLSKPISNRKSQ